MKFPYPLSVISRITVLSWLLTAIVPQILADPTDTRYSYRECLGSHLPYPEIEEVIAHPDSLTPVGLQHVGRHGARFPASASNAHKLGQFLNKADSADVLSPLGKELMGVVSYVEHNCRNRWGALDSLGVAEVRGIASRMFRAYPTLFTTGIVTALSSYAPRCVMSMYESLHQIDRLNNRIETIATTGRQNSPLMRPFDTDSDYVAWRGSGQWEVPYDMYRRTMVPPAPARRLLNKNAAATLANDEAQELALCEYGLLTGLPAMGVAIDLEKYFTLDEINALWSTDNLKMYLLRSASTLSPVPADIATMLLQDIIQGLETMADGTTDGAVSLRFGHAETLLPLLAMLHLKGCYYLTNYFDTVGQNWRNFDIVPMAANLQLILFKSNKGTLYLRVDLNETPIPLLPGSTEIYTPWPQARDYLNLCLPQYMQI